VKDKKVILIFLLLFLLILSVAGLIYYIKLSQNSLKAGKEEVRVLIAKKAIKKYQKIGKDDLAYQTMQKKYVPFKILLPNEVIGKLALVPILPQEPIRAEKLTTKIETKKEDITVIQDLKHDLYNINFRYFTNPNYTLKKDDLIDIIGVWTEGELQVKRIIKGAKVAGFLSAGNFQPRAKMTKESKNKEGKKVTSMVNADELLLDIEAKEIKYLIEIYNKGQQLWMTLANKNSQNADIKKLKKLESEAKGIKGAKGSKKPTVEAYKNVMKKKTINATISYAEDKNIQTFSKIVAVGSGKCNHALQVISKVGANVRFKPSLQTKRVGVAFYGQKIEFLLQEGDWFKLCDGNFMHKSVAKVVR